MIGLNLMNKTITLPKDPNEAQYEDFVGASLIARGYFIEQRLKFRDGGVELLELDVVATPANENYLKRILVEAKSGSWGFSDFFKVFGWTTFLKVSNGYIVHKNLPDASKAKMLEKLSTETSIRCCQISREKPLQGDAIPQCNALADKERAALLITAWYSLIGQRLALAKLIAHCKSSPGATLNAAINYQRACERSFFFRTALERVQGLCEAYMQNPKITGQLIEEIAVASNQETKSILYNLTGSNYQLWLQYMMLLEHKACVAIVKASLDHVLDPNSKDEVAFEFMNTKLLWSEINLPPGSRHGIEAVKKHEYAQKLPYLFQLFIEVYGGFYSIKSPDELDLLAAATGIPKEKIPDCLKLYEVFFPIPGGWFYKIKDELLALKMVPLLARGIGCFLRHYVFGLKNYAERYPANLPIGHWHNAMLEVLHPELEKKPPDS